jgi:secondary thiamine-phosphate synthase enzyme
MTNYQLPITIYRLPCQSLINLLKSKPLKELIEDIKVFLSKLVPESECYLHNDLHLRKNIPEDEPINAHSHLMAMMLNNNEIIPIVDGKLALGTYQSVLFFELDGARKRTILCQIWGE